MFPNSDHVMLFYDRTLNHIKRVSENLLVLKPYALSLGISEDDLECRRIFHDKSKFSEEEFIPYIWLTENIDDPLVTNAIAHHHQNNRHHPENFENVNEMSALDILEMVCDWEAMAHEVGYNNAYDWAKEHIGSTWHFNLGKLRIIGKALDILNKNRSPRKSFLPSKTAL